MQFKELIQISSFVLFIDINSCSLDYLIIPNFGSFFVGGWVLLILSGKGELNKKFSLIMHPISFPYQEKKNVGRVT